MFKLIYSGKAVKSLEKIPEKWRRKIIKSIDYLETDPWIGKKLKGQLQGFYSLRIWPYRVIYLVKQKEITVIIVDIGHRQGIYK